MDPKLETLLRHWGLAIKMVAVGAEHTVAISEDRNIYGWGWGHYGNLGLANRNDQFIQEEVAAINGEKFNMIACGWHQTITVSNLGSLYTYGWSKYGKLRHVDYEDHLVPYQVEGVRNSHIAQIFGGWRHTMALDRECQIYGREWNKFGKVGVGDNIDHCSPLPVTLHVE